MIFLSTWCLLIVFLTQLSPTQTKKVVCSGTSSTLTFSGDAQFRYRRLRFTYANCTHVEGNLEITWLDDPNLTYDLSFLNTIEEVTGYVLIAFTYADVIDLRNLRIIRGQELFSVKKSSNKMYGLYLANNWQPNSRNVGLKQLWMPNLRVIMAGDVLIYDCPLLCHTKHILWQDVLGPHQRVTYRLEKKYREFRTAYCPACDYTCPVYEGLPRCWGPSPQLCQRLHSEVCSPVCGSRQCYGHGDDQCCHEQCSGGCTGPRNTDCIACRNVVDEGRCVARCPPRVIYDPYKYEFHHNPRGKYQYGTQCVTQCPANMVRNGDTCVRACPAGMLERGGICIPCKNGECKMHCAGDTKDFVTDESIEQFRGCYVVENNLRLLWNTFEGDAYRGIGPLNLTKLEYLSSIREVRGYVAIQMPERLRDTVEDLSFLRNLEVIKGRSLYRVMRSGAALIITGSPLKRLGLTNLRKIDSGNVYFFRNPDLCYVHTVRWDRIFQGRNQIMDTDVTPDQCSDRGHQCDAECDGCWGPGQDQCQSCVNYQIGDSCVDSCDRAKNYYPAKDDFLCKQCDWRCKNGCTGPTKYDCLR